MLKISNLIQLEVHFNADFSWSSLKVTKLSNFLKFISVFNIKTEINAERLKDGNVEFYRLFPAINEFLNN